MWNEQKRKLLTFYCWILGKILFICHTFWNLRKMVTKFHKYVYRIKTMCCEQASMRLKTLSSKRCINGLVDAYQRPGSTILSVRTYLSRDCKTYTTVMAQMSGASSHFWLESSLSPYLVLVYPQCVQQRLVKPTNEALRVRSLVCVFSRCTCHVLKS